MFEAQDFKKELNLSGLVQNVDSNSGPEHWSVNIEKDLIDRQRYRFVRQSSWSLVRWRSWISKQNRGGQAEPRSANHESDKESGSVRFDNDRQF